MSSLGVRQCLKVLVSSSKSSWLQKKEESFGLARPIEKLESTDRKSQEHNFYKFLKQAQARENV